MWWECLFSLRDSCAQFVDKFRSFFVGTRILAATAYIFFASALPVIAFGEQLDRDTSNCLMTFSWELVILNFRWLRLIRICYIWVAQEAAVMFTLSWYWIRLGPSSKLIDEFLQIMCKHVDRNAFPLLCWIQSHSTVSSVTSSQADRSSNLVFWQESYICTS